MAYIPKTVYFSPDRVRAIMDQLAIDDKKLAQLVEASTATIWLRTGANQWKYVRRLICLEELLQKLPGHEVLGLIQQHITNETIDGLVTSGLLNASSVRAPWMGGDEKEKMKPITFLKFHPPLYEILEGKVSARTLSKLNEYLSINSTRL